jgi:long-chain acyl-CoA synthetase
LPTHPYLTQIVHQAARNRPSDPFLVFGDRVTTSAEFRDGVARFAGGLQRVGVRHGDRVAFLALNSDRLISGFVACWWAGAVPTPLNVRWTVNELTYALTDCGATVLVVDDPFAPMLDELRATVPTLQTFVYLGEGSALDDVCGYAELAAHDPIPDATRSGDDAAFVLYTGGTTGFSKGVEISHANLWSATMGMLAVGCGPGPVFLNSAPLFHIGGLQVLAGHLLNAQGPQVVLPAFDPAAVLGAIGRHRVTDVFLVPTMLQMLLAHPDFETADLSSLSTIYYGAAPMSEGLLLEALAKLPAVGFIQGYGMTETALTVMLPRWYYTVEGRKQGKINSVGRAVPGAEITIRDNAGNEVAPGTVGEVVVRGPSVTVGYIGNDAATASTIRDGWLYSGDAGYLDDDGFLYLVDRLKDMIISGAENVYSIEVERVLSLHPDVASCAVIGLPDARWGERVHAIVVRATAATASESDLIEHCRTELAAYKCPKSVEFLDRLPLSAAGKILKNSLRTERTPKA